MVLDIKVGHSEKESEVNSSQRQIENLPVIIVDSDKQEMGVVFQSLLEHGISNPITCQSGDELLSYIKTHHGKPTAPSLILLSCRINDADPFQLCETIGGLNNGLRIPIIMLADGINWWEEGAINKAYAMGANAVFFRPLRMAEIIPQVTSLLLQKQALDLSTEKENQLIDEIADTKAAIARYEHRSLFDDVTGLNNERKLEQVIGLALVHADNYSRESGLLLIELEEFDIIRQTEDYRIVNRLLSQIATSLRQSAPKESTIARVGSHKFGIFCYTGSGPSIESLADIITASIREITLSGDLRNYRISCSIGVIELNQSQSKGAKEALVKADIALWQAHNKQKNNVFIYSSEAPEIQALEQQRKWIPVIKDALDNDHFFLAFQPIIHTGDGSISHYECLLRLKDKNGVTHPAGDFLPIAEQMGLASQIDLWVIEKAIESIANLQKENDRAVPLAINISTSAFQNHSLLPLLKAKLDLHPISPSLLTFEVTEAAITSNTVEARRMITKLRALGCRFALDHFGSGFSSFNHIKSFPVDYVKIDGSFINNLLEDSTDQILVKSMIELASQLGKRTIAEYVENTETLQMLIEMGVDLIQGHVMGKPEPTIRSNERSMKVYNQIIGKSTPTLTSESTFDLSKLKLLSMDSEEL